jgi:hypothetical protein
MLKLGNIKRLTGVLLAALMMTPLVVRPVHIVMVAIAGHSHQHYAEGCPVCNFEFYLFTEAEIEEFNFSIDTYPCEIAVFTEKPVLAVSYHYFLRGPPSTFI